MCYPPLLQGHRYRRWTMGLSLAGMMTACASASLSPPLGAPFGAPPQSRQPGAGPGLAALQRAVQKEPTSPTPHVGLTQVYLEMGLPLMAVDAARTAVALAPSDGPSHAALAKALLGMTTLPGTHTDELLEAAQSAERALELQPDNSTFLHVALDVALAAGQVTEAAALMERLEARERENAFLLVKKARVRILQHAYLDAKTVLQRAKKLKPDPYTEALEAWATFMFGDENEAFSLYNTIPEWALNREDRLVLATLAVRRDALDEAQVQLKARYLRHEEESQLLVDLELLDLGRRGHLKIAALADLFEARIALKVGDLDRVESRLRRGLEVDLRLPEAPEMLAELLMDARKDPRQAVRVLGDAPTHTATHRRFHLAVRGYRALQDAIGAQEVLREYIELVALDVESGRRTEARQSLETMVILLPAASLWQFLVDLAVEEGDADGLLASWDHLKATVARPDTVFIVSTGEALIKLGRVEQAEKILRQALSKEPTHAQLLLNLAQVAQHKGDFHLAEETYRRVTVIHPSDALHWIALGQFYLQQQQLVEARGAFEEALRREQDPPDALAGLATVLSRLRMRDEALSTARRLTTVAPASTRSWYVLAQIAGESRRYEDQELALRQGILRDQNDATGWNLLARFLIYSPDPHFRRYEEGLAAARRAVALTHGREALYLGTLADALLEMGRLPEALQAVEQAIARSPESDEYHRQRRRIRSAMESSTSSTGGLQ